MQTSIFRFIKLKNNVKRKIKDFVDLELPLIAKKGMIPNGPDPTTNGKNLTANG